MKQEPCFDREETKDVSSNFLDDLKFYNKNSEFNDAFLPVKNSMDLKSLITGKELAKRKSCFGYAS